MLNQKSDTHTRSRLPAQCISVYVYICMYTCVCITACMGVYIFICDMQVYCLLLGSFSVTLLCGSRYCLVVFCTVHQAVILCRRFALYKRLIIIINWMVTSSTCLWKRRTVPPPLYLLKFDFDAVMLLSEVLVPL